MSDMLAGIIRQAQSRPVSTFRVGQVSSADPLELAIGGQDGLPASRLSSYTPSAGETVLVLQQESALVVLGRLISGG